MKTTDCSHEAPAVNEAQSFRADVLRELRRPAKELPCKYFYDRRGSDLFERICLLDEYYLTRSELAIMARCAPEMGRQIGPEALAKQLDDGLSLAERIVAV